MGRKLERLKIPDIYTYFADLGLVNRNGEVRSDWDPRLRELGWLEEVKEKSEFEKWNSKQNAETRDCGVLSTRLRKQGWNAALDAVRKLGPPNKCDAFLLSVKEIESLREP